MIIIMLFTIVIRFPLLSATCFYPVISELFLFDGLKKTLIKGLRRKFFKLSYLNAILKIINIIK